MKWRQVIDLAIVFAMAWILLKGHFGAECRHDSSSLRRAIRWSPRSLMWIPNGPPAEHTVVEVGGGRAGARDPSIRSQRQKTIKMVPNLDGAFAEFVGLLTSALLLGGYHWFLRGQVRRDPNYSIQAVNDRARAAWVENIMSGDTPGMLAVQTLRNSTMAAVFLASTAILLIMAVINLGHLDLNLDQGLKGIVEQLDASAASHKGIDAVRFVRLLPLLIDLFWAFFCFTLVVRANNHVGYLINTGDAGFRPAPAYVAQLLNQGTGYYTLGMRAYYIAVPLILDLFNPYYMVAATLVIIAVLYHIDRAPDADDEQFRAVAEAAPAMSGNLRNGKQRDV